MPRPVSIGHYIGSIIGFLVFVGLAILSFFVFSYLLIFGAAIGLVIFAIVYIRIKWLQHKFRQQGGNPKQQAQGRVIDQD